MARQYIPLVWQSVASGDTNAKLKKLVTTQREREGQGHATVPCYMKTQYDVLEIIKEYIGTKILYY